MNLVRSGEISQKFSAALDKAAAADTASDELKNFAKMTFGERKQELNKNPANLELLKEIDRYLDAGQSLSDDQLGKLQAAYAVTQLI